MAKISQLFVPFCLGHCTAIYRYNH